MSHFREFREITGYKGRLLTDPSRQSFKLLGLSSTIGGILGFKTLVRGFSALGGKTKPGSIQGSILQLGGAIVVAPDGTVEYLFQSKEASEQPPVIELLDSLV